MGGIVDFRFAISHNKYVQHELQRRSPIGITQFGQITTYLVDHTDQTDYDVDQTDQTDHDLNQIDHLQC